MLYDNTPALSGRMRGGQPVSGTLLYIDRGYLRIALTRQLALGVMAQDTRFGFLGFTYETRQYPRFGASVVFPGPGGSSGLPLAAPGPARSVQSIEMRLRLWTPCLLFALYPVVALVAWPLRSVHRRARNLCSKCGYLLVGNESGVCPECGRANTLWIIPRWQRIVTALLAATIACWVIEFLNTQLALDHRCTIWVYRTFGTDHGAWLVTSLLRTLVIGLVSVGAYIYMSPERFGEDGRSGESK